MVSARRASLPATRICLSRSRARMCVSSGGLGDAEQLRDLGSAELLEMA